MKHIDKNQSPSIFEMWKEQLGLEKLLLEGKEGKNLWDLLHSKCPPKEEQGEGIIYYSKQELREELLTEQGFICCYCNQSINNDHNTIIEHLQDKDSNNNLTFEYNNLLASCNGGQKDPKPKESHCDAAKEDKEISVTPLEVDCETHFYFDISGEIFSNTEKGEETIARLNLNIKKLKGLRAGAIEGIVFEDDFDIISDDKAHIVLEDIYQQEEKGNFKEFCFAIKNVIEREILNLK